MKKIVALILISVLLLSFAACSGTDQPDTTEPISTNSPTEQTPAPFDLDAYKAAVNSCREKIMTNALYLYNAGKWETNYLKALGRTSDETVDKAFSWLHENNPDADRETVDALHEQIRDEYAALIVWEIEGKEAEELDKSIRSMYEGYSDLYDCVTSNSIGYDSLVSKINDAIGLINGADEDLGLFLD